MREVVQTAQFKKDLRKVARSGRHRVEDLLEAVDNLARNERLSERYRDHALTGDLSAYRECHIRPDCSSCMS
jgi:mRNA interferase YafQ